MAVKFKLGLVLLAFKMLEGYGNRKVFQLATKLGLNSLSNSEEFDLIKIIENYNSTAKSIISIEEFEKNLDKSYEIQKLHRENEIECLTIFDEKYPNQLRDLSSPPLLLYTRGNRECMLGKPGIAIIGSRKATAASIDFAQKSAQILASHNIPIISGLALGCDTAAHEGTLQAGGETIAVLGGGLDNESIYPKGNLKLAQNIIDNKGCLVSEYPAGNPVAAYTLIERDRIQSGLSHTVLVIQTKSDGGSMQTYKFAKDQNRKVACYTNFENPAEFSGNIEILENSETIKIDNEKDLDQILSHQPNTLF